MQTVKYRYYYPIRRSLIPIIKSNRLQFFKKIVGNDEDETNFELSRKEFVIISTLFQTNIDHLLIYISLVFRYGGVFITVFHAFLQVCVGMPVYCLLTFMSSYTKSSFLKFFECIPILQGIGYTIGLLRFGTEIRNVMIASLSMIAIADILLHDKHVERIRQCMIGKHVQKSCLVMYPQKNHTMECPRGAKRKDIFFSTQFYFRSQVLQYNSTNLVCCKINGKLFGVSLCIWTLICCLSVFGMERIKKATVNIQIVFGCLLLSIAIYIVSFSNEDIQSVDAGTQIVFDRFEFWVDTILHTTGINLIASTIYLGKIKPGSLTPKHAALLVSLFKSTIFLLIVCFVSRVRQNILAHYKYKDPNCLVIADQDVLLMFIPDLLYRLEFGVVLNICWYLSIVVFAVLSPTYSVIIFVDTIIEQFQKLNKYRLFVYIVLCLFGATVHIVLCSNLNMAIIYTFQKYGVSSLKLSLMLLISIGLVFIYSIKRITDDYSFALGAPPDKYWVIFWRTIPMFSLFGFIFMIYQLQTIYEDEYERKVIAILSYIVSAFMILPVIIIFLAKCCTHVKYRTLGSLSRPSQKWGPYNPVKKQARKYFYPQRDLKYRTNSLNCNHSCMADSLKFDEEKRIHNLKVDTLAEYAHIEKPKYKIVSH